MIYKRGQHWHLDVTVNGTRYREALHTSDRREASAIEKKRIAEIHQGKAASKAGRDYGRMPLPDAFERFLNDRKPHTAERTHQLESNLAKPLLRFFQGRTLLKIHAEDIAAYQRHRRDGGISGRTVNMEVGLLRLIMKRAKVWSTVAEDVRMLPERTRVVGRVLTIEEKLHLFGTAAQRDGWFVVHCAATLAASTTCRGIELKHLRWGDVDLFSGVITIRRSKTTAGHRAVPINSDAQAALAKLYERSNLLSAVAPEHFVFPACERLKFDPSKPQKTWRTAWRSLVKEAAKRAGADAAAGAMQSGLGHESVEDARRRAEKPYLGFRFHDLRHQAITEMAESGESDATIMGMAGHVSREMMQHYTHVRMAAKRTATSKLVCGLMDARKQPEATAPELLQ